MVAHIGQIGVAGDIGAGGLIGVHDAGGDVVGDGGAHNGDGGGGLLGGLGRQGGVGHDQVNIVGNELGNDRGAVGRLIAGVLIVKLHLVAQQLGEGVLEPPGGLVQGGVLHLLADTDVVHPVGAGRGGGRAGAALRAAGGGGAGVGGPAHAGGEGQAHGQNQARGKKLFHVSFLLCEPVAGRFPVPDRVRSAGGGLEVRSTAVGGTGTCIYKNGSAV